MVAMHESFFLKSIACLVLPVILGGLTTMAIAAMPNPPTDEELAALRHEARSYEHGEGVAKDPMRAISLYCDGAKYGDAEAQYSLGWMYANGRGVPRNDEMAAYFFQLAANQGHEQSRKMVRYVGETTAPIPECMIVQVQTDPEIVAEDVFADWYEGANAAQRKILDLVRKISPEYGVNAQLAMAVIRSESNFEPTAVSPKNAQGLMQLIPDTSKRFNIKNPFDPEQNIRGGLAYLRWLLAYFEGNVALVAAAYNAGEGAVNRYRGIPPYAETRGYVKQIITAFEKSDHPYDPNVTAPSPELPRIRTKKHVSRY